MEGSVPRPRQHLELLARERRWRSAGIEVVQHALGLALVNVRGEHDLSTNRMLRDALQQALASRNVLIDLSGCSFVDAGVIGLLVTAAREVQARGDQLVLVIAPQQALVVRVIVLAGLTDVFPIYPSRQLALADLTHSRREPSPRTTPAEHP
jgi:anti-anti-sigma factor